MTQYLDFQSIDEVLDRLEMPKADGAGNQSVNNDAMESWDLGMGFDGAMHAYRGGWAEGAQKAEELAERIVPRPIGRRTTLVRDVVGALPNVGAYLAGAPNSMYRVSKKTAHARPYVHIYTSIGFSATCNANDAFDRGCALVALIDALEIAGCRVKVTLMRPSTPSYGARGKGSRSRYCMRFMVKDYGDRLDIDQLIFTAAHPAFCRRITFRLQENWHEAPGAVRDTRGGYGRPREIEQEDLKADGRAIPVILPKLEINDRGVTPEGFLARFINVLPEELQTEIQPEER